MTKEYIDREIVEYLDESVVWHDPVKKFSEQKGEYLCICGEDFRSDYTLTSHTRNNPKPKPTLEWMLGALVDKGLEVEFYPKSQCEKFPYAVNILSYDDEKYPDSKSDHWGSQALTKTLALREAVCKLIESESKK